jgi:hypothetical protein
MPAKATIKIYDNSLEFSRPSENDQIVYEIRTRVPKMYIVRRSGKALRLCIDTFKARERRMKIAERYTNNPMSPYSMSNRK